MITGEDFSAAIRNLAGNPSYSLVFLVTLLILTCTGGGLYAGYTQGNSSVLLISASVFLVSVLACLVMVSWAIRRGEQQAVTQGDLTPAIAPSSDERANQGVGGVIPDAYPATLDSEFQRASESLLIGIHQSHVIIHYHDLIRAKLSKGQRIRVLLLDPNCHAACEMTAMRFPGHALVTQEESRLQSTLTSFQELQDEFSNLIEIRVIPFLLAYGGFLFNWTSDDASVYIQRYTFKIHGGARKPKFHHRGISDPWLTLYRDEILAMWTVAYPPERPAKDLPQRLAN